MTALDLDGVVSRRIVRLEPDDFPELRADLAAVLDGHRAALVAYAQAEYDWPLDRDWGVEQVMMLACVIAAQKYATNVDDVLRTLHRTATGNAHREIAQAVAKVEKWLPDPDLLARLHVVKAKAESAWSQDTARLPKRPRGRPVEWELRLREYLAAAGLDRRQAHRYARELMGVIAAIARTP